MSFEMRSKNNKRIIFTQDFKPHHFQSEDLDYSFQNGQLHGKEWNFNDIRIIYAEIALIDFTELNCKDTREVVTLYFNFKGNFSVHNLTTDKQIEITENQHNIVYHNNTEYVIKANDLQICSLIIQLPKKSFSEIAQHGNYAITRFINAMENSSSAIFSDVNLNINFCIEQCIYTVLNCRMNDELKTMFFYSKLIELLVLQAESLEMNIKPAFIIKEYDRERILFAHDYLMKNLCLPPTLAELSRIAGINEYKLKKGFKEIFKLSVYKYLSEIRLELAKNMLLENKKNITEIAFELGYSSLQHFSSAFRKKFGTSPNQVK